MRNCTDGEVRPWRSLTEGGHRLVGVPGCATSLSCPHKKMGGDTLSGHPRLTCSGSAPSAHRRSTRGSPCATSGRACPRRRRRRHPRRSPARLRLTGFPGAALR